MTARPYQQHPSQDTLDQFAHLALQCYAPELRGEIRLLNHSENATYQVQGKYRRHVMRVHRAGYHERQEIASELAWLSALQQYGIEVPEAIAGIDGETIQSVELPGQDTRSVVLFHWIDGSQPDQQELNASFRRLGRINARLHRHARQWCRPEGFRRLTWNHHSMIGENGHWGYWQDAPYLDARSKTVIGETVEALSERMASYGEGESRFGLIHADLRLANLLVQGDHTRVIDFDDCGLSWYMHDLAAALSFFEHNAAVPQWIDHWLEGYSQEGSVDASDLAILPSLIIQRRLQLMTWTGSHPGTSLAESLGRIYVDQTVDLCHKYLQESPNGVLGRV